MVLMVYKCHSLGVEKRGGDVLRLMTNKLDHSFMPQVVFESSSRNQSQCNSSSLFNLAKNPKAKIVFSLYYFHGCQSKPKQCDLSQTGITSHTSS